MVHSQLSISHQKTCQSRHRGIEKAGIEGAVTFGVTNFAWVSSYVVSVPLGGALVDSRDDGIFHPLPHGGLPHDVALAAAGGLKASD